MPITAKFLADFTQFESASQSAAGKLKLVTSQTDAVAAGMTRAGREAASLGTAVTAATGSTTNLAGSFQKFDGILASVGIHMGPEIRAIGELSAASGKSAGELGKLATAGLVLGAGIAGWKIGRLIAEFFDLDKAIGSATAKLLGWGDLAKQEAGAGTDAIALAFERTGIHARSAGEAFKLSDKWLKEHNKSAVDAAKAATELAKDHEKAAEAATKAAAGLKKIAEEAAAATAAISAAHWADVGAIIDRVFGVDKLKAATDWSDAIDTLGGQVDQLSHKDLADLHEAMLEGIDALARSGNLTSELSSKFATLAVASQPVAPAIQAIAEATGSWEQANVDAARAIDAEFDALRAANAEHEKTPAAVQQATQSIVAMGTAIAFTAQQASAWNALMASTSNIGGHGQSAVSAGQAVDAGASTFAWATQQLHAAEGRGDLKHFATGGPVLQDGPIYAHAGEFVIPKGGGGTTVINNFYVNGSIKDLARPLMDEIARSLKQSLPMRPV